jgi:Mn-dependent DtxR family transcriptional regulator
MEKLTFTMENYLEAIYELSGGKTGARVSDIAERLGVTKASTNSAMATLSEKGLIINEKYKEIFLTPAGRRLAELTSQKHHVIRQFLTNILKVDAVIADKDACAIEHVISNDSINAMQNFLQAIREDNPCPLLKKI